MIRPRLVPLGTLLLASLGAVADEPRLPSITPEGRRVPREAGLRFEFVDLKSDQGHVRCGLYASADDYLKKALRETDGTITHGHAVCQFSGLPAGNYAVAAWHDANDNAKLDTNVFGIPNEGLAWSNNARGFAGPAKWKSAVFRYEGGTFDQQLKIRY